MRSVTLPLLVAVFGGLAVSAGATEVVFHVDATRGGLSADGSSEHPFAFRMNAELPSCVDAKLPGLTEVRGLPDFGKVAGFPDIPYSKIGLYADTWRGSDLELR